jgi:hypothetical protein
LDHRIGYIRIGFDADIVVWDSHPLAVGATPLQVYVDGKPTLEPEKVKESMTKVLPRISETPQQPKERPVLDQEAKDTACRAIYNSKGKVAFTGLVTSYIPGFSPEDSSSSNLTAVIDQGRLTCIGTSSECLVMATEGTVIHLTNGYISPGITSVARSLGLNEIAGEPSTKDGSGTRQTNPLDAKSVAFAKYGIHLDGKAFNRAMIGGVTRAVVLPLYDGGIDQGVSVGIRTAQNYTLLDGGIFKDDVALHMDIGQSSRGKAISQNSAFCILLQPSASGSTPSISLAIAKLRQVLSDNDGKHNVYGAAVNGTLPLVIESDNKV